jgi:hypothetical protein
VTGPAAPPARAASRAAQPPLAVSSRRTAA